VNVLTSPHRLFGLWCCSQIGYTVREHYYWIWHSTICRKFCHWTWTRALNYRRWATLTCQVNAKLSSGKVRNTYSQNSNCHSTLPLWSDSARDSRIRCTRHMYTHIRYANDIRAPLAKRVRWMLKIVHLKYTSVLHCETIVYITCFHSIPFCNTDSVLIQPSISMQ